MKKALALCMALVMAVSCVSCGSKTEPGEDNSSSPAGGGETYTIDIALHTVDGTSEDACDRFKEAVESATNGNITVNIFDGGTLGTEAENITQLSTGEIQCALLGSLYPEQVLPEWNITGIPFAFPSVEAVEEYWTGELGEKMEQESIENANIHLAGLVRRGARLLTANKPIEHPEEVAGLKLRLPENATWVTVWQSLGAMTTPVNWNETYTSLQTNVVDAQENPIATYYSARIQEVQDYTIVTNHLYNHFYWAFNEDFLQSLPAEYQEIVLNAVTDACEWAKGDIEAKTAEFKQALIDEGHTFIEIDFAEWTAAARDGIMKAAEVSCDEAKAVLAQYVG